jgi:sulfite reductase (NADPH) flavoprotein alpha-component
MIPEAKLNILQELISNASREEILWINGYLNGIVSSRVEDKPKAGATRRISILYGTETGNSRKLALQLTADAKKQRCVPKCTGMDQYKPEDLLREEYLFIIVSTHGEGEPPEAAKKFYDFLHHTEQPLAKLKYSILALGDSSYPLFCKTGDDMDAQLQRLGATRITPVVKCDVDFDEPAAQWFRSLFTVLGEGEASPAPAAAAPVVAAPVARKAEKKIYDGLVSRSVNLNDSGSTRNTWHIEIRTEEDMDYEAGDSVAIVPTNRPEVVERIITMLEVKPDESIELPKASGTVVQLLTEKLGVCYLLASTIKKYAALTGHQIPDIRMDLVDLLRIYPWKTDLPVRELLTLLHPIAPRLYSVASSPLSDARQVDLTVSLNRFMKEDEQHYGLCSRFLGELPQGSPIKFYIHRNRSFKLPEDSRDIIMVGPGTGIAPFRSFLQERDMRGASGKNWLFFGERHFTTDFFYQTEIQQYHQTGLLQKVHVAFSRDLDRKVYVQHRMLEQAEELYRWLEAGAIFYVAGSRHPMSDEVEQTLLKIARDQGAKDDAGAQEWLQQLKKEGRYHKDVY